MKTVIKRVLTATLMVSVLALGVSFVSTDAALAAPIDQIRGGVGSTTDDQGDVQLDNVFKDVVNVLLYVIGAISVVMLIWGGIRYTVSGGNSTHVTAAKNTIMYAVIGLVVAFLAYAIINWVLGALTGGTP